jgi:hypothetical protein
MRTHVRMTVKPRYDAADGLPCPSTPCRVDGSPPVRRSSQMPIALRTRERIATL